MKYYSQSQCDYIGASTHSMWTYIHDQIGGYSGGARDDKSISPYMWSQLF